MSNLHPQVAGDQTSKAAVRRKVPLPMIPFMVRNFILKTYRFKKNHLKTEHSLSSRFAPFMYRAAEINSQLADRTGLFEEDDEYPPSASHRRRIPRPPTFGEY